MSAADALLTGVLVACLAYYAFAALAIIQKARSEQDPEMTTGMRWALYGMAVLWPLFVVIFLVQALIARRRSS